jgi:hypothetical protein
VSTHARQSINLCLHGHEKLSSRITSAFADRFFNLKIALLQINMVPANCACTLRLHITGSQYQSSG